MLKIMSDNVRINKDNMISPIVNTRLKGDLNFINSNDGQLAIGR